ncbi:MAG: hypothetical protein AAFQ94_24685 [Bacteroidota bacterium]
METLEAKQNDYYYFKDKYALDVLALSLKDQLSVSELKRSPLGFLTNKKSVSKVLAKEGNGSVSCHHFENVFSEESVKFSVSLGKWGKFDKHLHDDWYQTSRNGENLVLQLNFDKEHLHEYFRLIDPEKDSHPFMYDCHPVLKKSGFTLAWARLDVDLTSGEVLIEEIQNDWIREAKDSMVSAKKELEKEAKREKSKQRQLKWAKDEIDYFENSLKDYVKIWDEAMLNLAIQFAVKELGCYKIYYHTFDSGNLLKGLKWGCKPPKSLYTKLPRRFGFQLTDEAPALLRNNKKLRKKLRDNQLSWFLMQF